MALTTKATVNIEHSSTNHIYVNDYHMEVNIVYVLVTYIDITIGPKRLVIGLQSGRLESLFSWFRMQQTHKQTKMNTGAMRFATKSMTR